LETETGGLILKRFLRLLAITLLLAPPAGASAITVSGAGATFPYPIYAKWAEAYKAETGIGVNYQSIGSGGGIRQITSRTVDFGATDMPLTQQALKEAGLIQFPTVIGGIVPVVNVRGIAPGEFRLTGRLLADIYLGKITRWNDPAIAAVNPGRSLPHQAIAVVYRSDGSGTTFLFAHYLAKMSPEWDDKIGVATALEWPTGMGGKGNEGVAAITLRTNGAIGYVEYAFAKENRLPYALLANRDGHFVAPDIETFQAAAANADWGTVPGYGLVLTDQPGARSWPITGATFILMPTRATRPDAARHALSFFAWAYAKGDTMAEALHYVPLPDSVVPLVAKTWQAVVDGSGRPVRAPAAP
jgi:phosphate transport system substrate-binding protein